jgi:hypothetical protein
MLLSVSRAQIKRLLPIKQEMTLSLFGGRMFIDGERHFVALYLLFVSTTGACYCAQSWVVNELLEYNRK